METKANETSEPQRTRAVFSQQDFGLIRTAIEYYFKEVRDEPNALKYSNLYHRLARIT